MLNQPHFGSDGWTGFQRLIMLAMPIVVPFLIVGVVIVIVGALHELSQKIKYDRIAARVKAAEAAKSAAKKA